MKNQSNWEPDENWADHEDDELEDGLEYIEPRVKVMSFDENDNTVYWEEEDDEEDWD